MSTVTKPDPHTDETSHIAPSAKDVHDAIRNLLADEYPDLANTHGGKAHREPYLHISTTVIFLYIKFVLKTCAAVPSTFVQVLSFKTSLQCFWELLFFSALINIVLGVGVIICLVAKFPPFRCIFQHLFHGGVGVVNIIDNKMFGRLSEKEICEAKRALKASESAEHKEFNLDIAKLLLLFASIMYERTSITERQAIKDATSRHHMHLNSQRLGLARLKHFPAPGNLIRDVFGPAGHIDIEKTLRSCHHVDRIQEFARNMEVEFEPISELNSISSAYCALFWGVRSNWIVVAFKGTSPTEFDEWITDFDITRVAAGSDLPGYGSIHHGFKERIFPEQSTRSRSPYETILRGIDIVAKDLIRRRGKDTEINVYFTGHSLGCATSALTYAGMIEETTLDPQIRIRDAYLFAAPVVCDMPSVRVFNQRTEKHANKPKTMWRIVNGNDVVAVGLPCLGDRPTFKHPENILAFAHLGTELKMRKKPIKCVVSDYYATIKTSGAVAQVRPRASIVSRMHAGGVGVAPKGESLPCWKDMLQHLPIIGDLFAHFPGYYWEALQLVGIGEAHWDLL